MYRCCNKTASLYQLKLDEGPSAEHFDTALELAEALIPIKGVQAAKVLAHLNGITRKYLVRPPAL